MKNFPYFIFMKYINDFCNLILKKLNNKTSILLKEHKGKIYFNVNEKLIYKGVNQFLLAENYFSASLQMINSQNNNKKILIGKKTENKIKYKFLEETKIEKILTLKRVEHKNYNFFIIPDIFEYYFTTCVNNETYKPFLDKKEIENLMYYIKVYPYQFAIDINKTFEKIIKGVIYE